MRGVGLQPRVVHALHLGMPLERPRNGKRAGVVLRHPQGQRLHPPQQQRRHARVRDGAELAARVADGGDQPLPTRDHTRQQIVVPTQVLGRRVDHQVRTMRERAIVHRRRERRVDHDFQASRPLLLERERSEVRDELARVARRLQKERARPTRLDRGGDRRRIVRGRDRGVDAEPAQRLRKKLLRRPVAVARHDKVLARPQQRQERRAQRRHAAGHQHRVLRALKRRDLALGGAHRRIRIPRVVVRERAPLHVIHHLRHRAETEGRRGKRGRDDGTRTRRTPLSGVHGERRVAVSIVGHRRNGRRGAGQARASLDG